MRGKTEFKRFAISANLNWVFCSSLIFNFISTEMNRILIGKTQFFLFICWMKNRCVQQVPFQFDELLPLISVMLSFGRELCQSMSVLSEGFFDDLGWHRDRRLKSLASIVFLCYRSIRFDSFRFVWTSNGRMSATSTKLNCCFVRRIQKQMEKPNEKIFVIWCGNFRFFFCDISMMESSTQVHVSIF